MEHKYMINSREIIQNNIVLEQKRVKTSSLRLILLGILAGLFVACGATAGSVVTHTIDNVGFARLLAGIVYPVGIMMVVFVGGELFTSDCLLILGIMDKKYKVTDMLRVLLLVYMGNVIGTGMLTLLVHFSGRYYYSEGLLGAYTIRVAMAKIDLDFGMAFSSGIICNLFGCAAVLMASAAKDAGGKLWTVFFPIMTFVVSGYEHCVANMYFIPAGILASKNRLFTQIAMSQYGYSAEQLSTINWKNYIIHSAIPVTLGNAVGGMALIGIILYLIYKTG